MQTETQTTVRVTELRIGNLISIEGKILPVYHIRHVAEVEGSTQIYAGWKENKSEQFRLEDISPIPLSPEILEKAGFVIQGEKPDRVLYLRPLAFNYNYEAYADGKIGDCYVGNDYGATHVPNLYYLHQLQNLYFALTGEELKIDSL